MRKTVFLASILVMVLGFAFSAQATLVDMNDGTIYDTSTQLSWLKNANTAGAMTWSNAVAWAASLNNGGGFAGLTGWRLPATTQPDASCGYQANNGGFPLQGYGYNCTGSEMGHLFYVSLGNKGYCDALNNCPQAGWGLTNTGPFTNMQAGYYWSGTEFAPNASDAWGFGFGHGSQGFGSKVNYLYAWAVRPGARSQSQATPVPASGTVGLIVLGLAGVLIVGMRLRRASR